MNRYVSHYIFIVFIICGCNKTVVDTPTPPDRPDIPRDTTPVVKKPIIVLNEYDAAYVNNTGGASNSYTYHVKDTLYYAINQDSGWHSLIYNASDTLYSIPGQINSTFNYNKGCIALVSGIDPSQQVNFDHYIGSYYKFSLFNDTTVGNLQFMVPTKDFPSVDSIPVGVAFLNFYGGNNSFYRDMPKAEVKVLPNQNFVRFGDSFSYANPLIPATGTIDSVEVHMLVTRFSDNGIHPSPEITKTMDANYFLKFYFKDGSYFSVINAKFTNLFFQKKPM